MIRLRASDHTYWVKTLDRWHRVPGVNEIVRAAVAEAARFYTEEARRRGTAVHEALALHLSQRGLDWSTLEEGHAQYVAEGVLALEIASAKPMLVEEILYEPELGFAGRPDFIGSLFGSQTASVVDHKTGSVPKIAGLTTAGYGLLARRLSARLPMPPLGYDFRRYALELRPGYHRFIGLHDTTEGHLDEARFLACLDLYRAFSFREDRMGDEHVEPFDPDRD